MFDSGKNRNDRNKQSSGCEPTELDSIEPSMPTRRTHYTSGRSTPPLYLKESRLSAGSYAC